MVLPRTDVFRAAQVLRSLAARATRPKAHIKPIRQIGRRGYASHGSAIKKSSSDLPWLVGAVVVTVPSCAYLLQPSSNKDHGHGHGDEGHEEHEEHGEHEEHEEHEEPVKPEEHEEPAEHDGAENESTKEEGGDDSGEAKSQHSDEREESPKGDDGEEDGSDGKSEDSDSDNEEQQDTPDTSDDESSMNTAHETDSGGDVEGVQFKGGPIGDTRKHIPDVKGGNKKRIESDAGKRQGVGDNEDAPGSKKDKPAASKPALSQNQMSGKQEGLSNTDTKHSIDLTNNPEKSKKGEGTPETSKTKGPVDPFRPQK